MTIELLNEKFTICKVADFSVTDFSQKYCFVGVTDEENSLICMTDMVPINTLVRNDGWRAFRISGELDFSLIGILSKILGLLADKKIGIAAVSTYNTDYVFVKEYDCERAMATLSAAGYEIK